MIPLRSFLTGFLKRAEGFANLAPKPAPISPPKPSLNLPSLNLPDNRIPVSQPQHNVTQIGKGIVLGGGGTAAGNKPNFGELNRGYPMMTQQTQPIWRLPAHGGGPKGNYSLENRASPGSEAWNTRLPERNDDLWGWNERRKFSDAKNVNPSAVESVACNREGGCTPDSYGNMFDRLNNVDEFSKKIPINLKKVIMTPPGYYGTALADSSPFVTDWVGRHSNEGLEGVAAKHEYDLIPGFKATDPKGWADNGVFTDNRQFRQSAVADWPLPAQAIGEAREAGQDWGRGRSMLDKMESINTNPDISYRSKVNANLARPITSTVAAGKDMSDISNLTAGIAVDQLNIARQQAWLLMQRLNVR